MNAIRAEIDPAGRGRRVTAHTLQTWADALDAATTERDRVTAQHETALDCLEDVPLDRVDTMLANDIRAALRRGGRPADTIPDAAR